MNIQNVKIDKVRFLFFFICIIFLTLRLQHSLFVQVSEQVISAGDDLATVPSLQLEKVAHVTTVFAPFFT